LRFEVLTIHAKLKELLERIGNPKVVVTVFNIKTRYKLGLTTRKNLFDIINRVIMHRQRGAKFVKRTEINNKSKRTSHFLRNNKNSTYKLSVPFLNLPDGACSLEANALLIPPLRHFLRKLGRKLTERLK
jgi:hypothetical protein